MRGFIPIAAMVLMMMPSPTMQASAQQSAPQHRLADNLQRKLDHVSKNAKLTPPDHTPTVMTEGEINDYLAAGLAGFPQGVKNVRFEGQTGVVTGIATVDFDAFRTAQTLSNPLLSMFRGTHEVRIEADGAGNHGEVRIHMRKVSIDGIDVPQSALEIFLGAFITPLYPNIGVDSGFDLPDRIDRVTVGDHTLTIIQK